MILFNQNKDKVVCTQTKQPKFRNKNNPFDHISTSINDVRTDFWFSLKNNASYFYFRYDEVWYKTAVITNDEYDLYNGIYEKGDKLFTKEYLENLVLK